MVLPSSDSVVKSEFLFEAAPFASAHASTIVETHVGLVAAWFGGTREGAADVGIWLTRLADGRWEPPIEVANGIQPDGTRYPCWNPVLFVLPDSALALFYKVGPSPQRWWGMVRTSHDGGRTWTGARRLPDGFLGPIKNKPLRLANNRILAGSSTESPERPSVWRVHFERSEDGGQTWTATAAVASAGAPIDAIQPAILIHPGAKLQAVGRTRSGRLFETWSDDSGSTWTPLALTTLPNPNSGIDAITLRDGRHLIVYAAERRVVTRWQDVGSGRRPGARPRRVLVSSGDSGRERTGARDVHVEARADQARGAGPGKTEIDPYTRRRLAVIQIAPAITEIGVPSASPATDVFVGGDQPSAAARG